MKTITLIISLILASISLTACTLETGPTYPVVTRGGSIYQSHYRRHYHYRPRPRYYKPRPAVHVGRGRGISQSHH